MISWRSGPLSPCLLFLACCALYLVNLNNPPDFDELYHVLAARGFQETGHYVIADGIYSRGWPFTRLIAALFHLFGEHLWVARLPSLACVAAMVTLLFIWLRREVGIQAALIAAILFAVSPFAIDIAHFARFYAIHGLAFLVGSLCLYDLTVRSGPRSADLLRGSVAIMAFAVATMFQVTTLIGLGVLGAWLILQVAGPWFLNRSVPIGRRLIVLAALLVLMVLAVAAADVTGILAKALAVYRSTPLWSAENANDIAYYHVWLILYYPTLWTLMPILFATALVAQPRTAFFMAFLFGTGLAVHSFAGSKNLRYVFYIMPFLFALWGVGLAATLSGTLRLVHGQAAILVARLFPGRRVEVLALMTVMLAVAWLMAANAASVRSMLMLANITMPPELPPVRWNLARSTLEPFIRDADVVVVTSELDALYFLGRYDVLVSKSRLDERPGSDTPEFTIDPRTGRPMISRPEALARLMACHRTGIIVSSIYRWRRAPMLDDAVADMIIRSTEPVALPRTSRVIAYTWNHEPAADPMSCSTLPALAASRAVDGAE